jgi:hypothetical protein
MISIVIKPYEIRNRTVNSGIQPRFLGEAAVNSMGSAVVPNSVVK